MKKLFENSVIFLLLLLTVFSARAQNLTPTIADDSQNTLVSTPGRSIKPPDIEWFKGTGRIQPKIGNFVTRQFKNAGRGGKDWTIFGRGSNGGEGSNQLWLFDSPSRAIVNFTEKSTAIAFMMRGDHNDGFARFIVDGKSVGIFDLFQLGNKTLVVSGLPFGYHTIQVVHFGKQNDRSSDDNVALYGGAALVSSDLGLKESNSGETKIANLDEAKAALNGKWKAIGFKRNRWFFKLSSSEIVAFYSSRYEIGRAEGKFENNKLTLRYVNAYQNDKKYLTAQGAVSSGKIKCQIIPDSVKLVCRDLGGKINQGLDFVLVRSK